jgi:hypothetical protein
VTNSSVPFRSAAASRTQADEVTNSSVVAGAPTTAPTETTPSTTADGCPTDGVGGAEGAGGRGVQGAGGSGGNGSGGSGGSGGGNLPITGLSLLALLVAGAATLTWGFVARMVAARKTSNVAA